MEKKFPSVMMHVLGLIRMGYLVSPIKGYYEMTNEGKRYLELLRYLKNLLEIC